MERRLKGPRFDIVPGDHAVAHDSTFVLKTVPLFYTPFFYHSLSKEPRHSGFLIPNISPHSQRGFMLGLGYYWAISRSYDITYRLYDYNSSALRHHVEVRGKPNSKTDFDSDRFRGCRISAGILKSGDSKEWQAAPQKYSGVDIYGTAKSDLGNGWTGMAMLNYVTSFRFRQEWTENFNEGSQHRKPRAGFREQGFWRVHVRRGGVTHGEFSKPEIAVPGANGATDYLTNAVIIRKLPEANFSSRPQQVKEPAAVVLLRQLGMDHMRRGFRSRTSRAASLVYNYVRKTSPFTSRLRMDPRVSTAFHLWGINFAPSFGLHEAFYGESQALTPSDGIYRTQGSDIVRNARDFTLDMTLPTIERVFNKKTIFGDKLKHVIEPRVTYKYQTGIGTDYDRFVRFDENDLMVNTNELDALL